MCNQTLRYISFCALGVSGPLPVRADTCTQFGVEELGEDIDLGFDSDEDDEKKPSPFM